MTYLDALFAIDQTLKILTNTTICLLFLLALTTTFTQSEDKQIQSLQPLEDVLVSTTNKLKYPNKSFDELSIYQILLTQQISKNTKYTILSFLFYLLAYKVVKPRSIAFQTFVS